MMVVNAKTHVGTIYSRESSTPTVDGVLNVAEWSEGISQDITMYEVRDQLKELELSVMSLYDVDEILYLGITIYDDTTGLDELAILIRVSASELISTVGTTYTDVEFNADHDLKMVYLHNNVTEDLVVSGLGQGIPDGNFGGTNDITGKCHYFTDSYITVELAIPFDSSDVPAAFDPVMHVNDKIELLFLYKNETTETIYSQVRVDDDDYDYVILDIGGSPTQTANGLTIIATVVCLLSVNAIYISKRKRQKI
ncbi:MAG: hypothetical protein FK731_12420 [Asgard group archaeon]|nr:hypothetical protein [Asgard group archaeon]